MGKKTNKKQNEKYEEGQLFMHTELLKKIDENRRILNELMPIHYAEINMIKFIKNLKNMYYGYFNNVGEKIDGVQNMQLVSQELKDLFKKEISRFDDVENEIFKYQKLDNLIKK